jgi:DNA-binding transcriptional LysR family regulator
MVRKIDWETQLGRRIKLRDLHVFFNVVQRGSMAKAAVHLGVSQSAVSEVIASLEHALGVRLLDRGPHGVEPTIYGRTLLKRGTVAFDELKQGIKEIEFLADPTVGELRIGCAESVSNAILLKIIHPFCQQYPRVVLHVKNAVSPKLDLPELRDRSLDLFISRLPKLPAHEDDDLNVEILFGDEMVVAAGVQSRFANRCQVDLAELVNEPWILTPPGSWNYMRMAEAFCARGFAMPKVSLMTFSIHLRANLLSTGAYVSAFPSTFLRLNADRFSMKALPVNLPARPWPVAIVTLKNRTLSPLVQIFIDHLRAFANSMGAELTSEQTSA